MTNHRIFTAATAVILGLSSISIGAQDIDYTKYFTISSVDTHEVMAYEHNDGFVDGGSALYTAAPIDPSTVIDPGKIIEIGNMIWKIIDKNRPVVEQNYQAISAVPSGITSWKQLERWSPPQIRVYEMSFKNTYKQEVVKFNYRVAYAYGGGVKGVGQYLARVEIEPAVLNVSWGYKFTANGQVLNVINAGTEAEPMAAMELRLNWKVDSMLKHIEESKRYYVRGDGLFTDLSGGNIPSH